MRKSDFQNKSRFNLNRFLDTDTETRFQISRLEDKRISLKRGIEVFILLSIVLQVAFLSSVHKLPVFLIMVHLWLYLSCGNKRRELMDLFNCCSLMVAFLSIIYIAAISSSGLINTVLAPVILAGYSFFKIRTIYAGITGLLSIAGYAAFFWVFSIIEVNEMVENIAFLCSVNALGLAIGYYMEYQSRLLFVKSSELEHAVTQIEKHQLEDDEELVRVNKSLALEILAHTEAEAQLKESEEKYKNLVNSLPEGIFIIQNSRIVFVNPSILEITGFEQEQLINADKRKLLDSDFDEDRIVPGIIFSSLFKRKDGHEVHIEQSYVEIVYNAGPALLFAMRDITEQVNARQDKDLLEKELYKAKKMEALGLLAGGVAHDLNNILSGIVSTPELLLMDLPEDSQLSSS